MRIDRSWVPVRWPGGRETLAWWQDPSSLDLLRGTPFNCVVLTWATGQTKDSAQAARIRDLIERGRNAGLTFLASVEEESADAKLVAAAATAAGCAGVLSGVAKGVWPQVQISKHGGDSADAGPTGAPWIDSNGWIARLAGARAPGSPVWLAFDPPEAPAVVRPESYELAIAEAAAYSSRWVVSLDKSLLDGLAAGRPPALAAWRQVVSTARFFERHQAWSDLYPRAFLGILSDLSEANDYMAGEFMNLAARRGLLYKVVEKSRTQAGAFAGLKALLYLDQEPPDDALRGALLEFARNGGLVIGGPVCRPLAAGLPPTTAAVPRYDVYSAGKGRIALAHAAKDFEDPYIIAGDAQLLLSHRNDLIRFWNSGSVGWHYLTTPDLRHGLIHILNYSARERDASMGINITDSYRIARAQLLDAGSPSDLQISSSRFGVEIPLPSVSVYAAIELGN